MNVIVQAHRPGTQIRFPRGQGARRRLSAGEVNRIAKIVNRHARRCTAVGPKRRTDDVDDARQELWLRVLNRLDQFDSTRGRLEAFVEVVLRFGGIDLIRKRRRKLRLQKVVLPTESSRTVHRQVLNELQLDVATVLAQMPTADREILVAVGLHGVMATARGHGIPRSTLRYRLTKYRAAFDRAGLLN